MIQCVPMMPMIFILGLCQIPRWQRFVLGIPVLGILIVSDHIYVKTIGIGTVAPAATAQGLHHRTHAVWTRLEPRTKSRRLQLGSLLEQKSLTITQPGVKYVS
eukprot:m.45851 g.45851  ORF g.45851 m.45851 type:complete len:103 (-) comp10304_c0_seq1:120-428(-)